MRIRFASFPFPFRTRFEHAAAARDMAENVIVLARCKTDVVMKDGRDLWWPEIVDKAPPRHELESCDSEHPLFSL